HDALGELHERVKRYDSALFYNKLFGDASHKDFNLRRNDQVASLEAHYNLELTNQQLLLNQEVLKSQRTLLISIGVILLIVIISSFIIFRLYLRYRAANKQLIELNSSINEKNEEILAQSDELKSVNDAMQQINSNLESIVEERTHEVKMRNDKLVEYAYFNAHKVRGPLARILGLINLLEMDKEESDLNVFLEKMRTSALELDEVVREINKKLDTD
ncbi:MAG TPA: hypothetical protein VGK39_03635, partial [Cyclobacteriaceae bacterium]